MIAFMNIFLEVNSPLELRGMTSQAEHRNEREDDQKAKLDLHHGKQTSKTYIHPVG